jgi:osmotically-inducible protein OsmY
MNPHHRLLAAIVCALSLSACTSILTATAEGPIVEDPGSRTLGSYIDDQIIETKISVNISKTDPALQSAPIDVNCHNGIVLLTGQVDSEELKLKAGDVANKLRKVRKVHNELVVAPPISLLASSNDSWISTKVKSKMSLESTLDASRIKVITENGVVYLMGLVSRTESEISARIASETGGVQKVIRVFEYY